MIIKANLGFIVINEDMLHIFVVGNKTCIRCCVGESNGTPLQYFCLENLVDGGAWWAAVHGVARVGHD